MVADLGCVDLVAPLPAFEPCLRQRGEGGVGFGSGRCGRVLRRSVGGGRGWRLWLAGGEGEGEQGDGGQGLAHGGSGRTWEVADSVPKPPRRPVAFACCCAEQPRCAQVQAPCYGIQTFPNTEAAPTPHPPSTHRTMLVTRPTPP